MNELGNSNELILKASKSCWRNQERDQSLFSAGETEVHYYRFVGRTELFRRDVEKNPNLFENCLAIARERK